MGREIIRGSVLSRAFVLPLVLILTTCAGGGGGGDGSGGLSCNNSLLQGTWYESTGFAATHFPAQVQFVNTGSTGGLFYGYASGPLQYSFESDPVPCGSIMITDAAQTLIITYDYTLAACELILSNWGSTHHYCRGGMDKCTTCN